MKSFHIDCDKLYFSADHHLGHSNIIKYQNRPFNNVAEMDEVLIDKWNAAVPKGSTVIYLGDFAFAPAQKYIDRIHSKIIFIQGNHDKPLRSISRIELPDMLKVVPGGAEKYPDIVCCHYAMLIWPKSHHGAWHLHGHSHGSLKYPYEVKAHDVGVDNNDFTPVSFSAIKKIMDSRKTHKIDHH